MNLSPSNAAILQTERNTISISFPKGAVVSQTQISLVGLLPEQLPSPPSDFAIGATCFKVEGLNGLLAKEATLTIKYSAADLDKAGGDASKLALARWNEGDNRWEIVKTRVNQQNTTLTANTVQLGIWAAVILPTSPTNFLWLFEIILGVILVSLVVIFLTLKRRYKNRQKKIL